MLENENKKINYKILTADYLFKEELPATKEIKHEEEKIEAPQVQKITEEKEVIFKPKEKFEEKIETIQTQTETGLIYPETETFKEEQLKPKITETVKPRSFKKDEFFAPKSIEISFPKESFSEEKKEEENIFYMPKKEEAPSKLNYFKPKPEILQKEIEKKETLEKIHTKEKLKFKIPVKIYKFLFFTGIIVLTFGLFLLLKPQEKFKALFKKEDKKQEATVSIQEVTPTIIFFPEIKTQPTTTEPTTEPTTETEIPITSTEENKALFFEKEMQGSGSISFLQNFFSKEIILSKLDASVWQEEFKKFLSFQEPFGTKLNIDFIYNNKRIANDFIFDYFIKPKSIKIEDLKNNFTLNYNFLIYYGYTRKYPILIFEIKDKEKVKKINQEWERLTMKEDLKALFFDLEPPKTKNNFATQKYKEYSYRILNFGDNFKIIWLVVDNYLIYGTTETGVKEILDLLQ